MGKELYLSVEGPKGKADIFEVTEPPQPGQPPVWEPKYEVHFGGNATTHNSEGEALTVAQQLSGAPDNY